MNTDYAVQVEEAESSFLMYARYGVPITQALPFIVPSRFSFRNMGEEKALTICSFVSVSESMGKKVSKSSTA